MPNHTNITTLLTHLNHLFTLAPNRFEMNHWSIERQGCGTAHCLGGWCHSLANPTPPTPHTLSPTDYILCVSHWLDIPLPLAEELCYMQTSDLLDTVVFDELPDDVRHATLTNVLTHLRDHQIVDWDRAFTSAKEQLA